MRHASCIVMLSSLLGCEHALSIGSLRRDEGDANGGSMEASVPLACEARGPLLAVGDGHSVTCDNGRGASAFRFGACSCDDFVSSAELTFDAFGSAMIVDGTYGDGSLGANGGFFPRSASVSGTLHVSGAEGIPSMGNLDVGQDLLDQGLLDGNVDVSVGRNARVGGNVRVRSLSVGGTLGVSAAANVEVTSGAPPVRRENVQVEAPCDCTGGPDITGLVRAARDDNDNAAVALDPDTGMKALSGPLELSLPCGRYFVTEIYAPNPLTLTITGRVTLLVDGKLITEQGGGFNVQLAPGAELDLLLTGEISSGAPLALGSASTPGRVRVYTSSTGSVYLAGETTLSGSLYAPTAELVNSGRFELYGAVLARRMVASGPFRVHYDRALMTVNCGL